MPKAKPQKNSSNLTHFPMAAGADEAGRGPLAGPVVAAAVILPDTFDLDGINDSKQVPEKKRRELEERIKSTAVWAVEAASVEEVDQINILWASMAAMERAVCRLSVLPTLVLVDGHILPKNLPCEGKTVVKGDSIYACIAAASILAKNARDEIMRGLAEIYPEYGFENHFGYATPEHRQALEKYGPCPIHRRSFVAVSNLLQLDLGFDE